MRRAGESKPAEGLLSACAVGRVEKITGEGNQVLSGTQITFPVFGYRVAVIGEETFNSVSRAAFTSGPLKEFGYTAMAGTGSNRVKGVTKTGRVVPVELREEKFHSDLTYSGVDLLKLFNLDVPGIVGGAGDQFFDQIFTRSDLFEFFLVNKELTISPVIKKEVNNWPMAIYYRQKERGSGVEVHIGTVLQRFLRVSE